jgi:hypothetical protein
MKSDPFNGEQRMIIWMTVILASAVVLLAAIIAAGVVTTEVLKHRYAVDNAVKGQCPHIWSLSGDYLKSCDVCGETLVWREGSWWLLAEEKQSDSPAK